MILTRSDLRWMEGHRHTVAGPAPRGDPPAPSTPVAQPTGPAIAAQAAAQPGTAVARDPA